MYLASGIFCFDFIAISVVISPNLCNLDVDFMITS